MMSDTIFAIFATISLGIAFSSTAEMFVHFYRTLLKGEKESQPKTDISDRIKTVTAMLSAPMKELNLLQLELEQRIKLVEKLKEDAEQAEQIISMSEEQVSAVRKALNQELQKEGKKSFWQGVAVNFIFFILGAAASFIISKYLA